MPAIYHEGSWLGNATDPEVLVKDTVGWTGKNLLKNEAVSATARGVTRTVNSDGSITLDGTNSVSGPAVIELNLGFELEAGTYILSGTPVGAWVNDAGFRLQVYDLINSVQIATDEGSGKTFTLSEKKTLRTRIWFSDGASISNLTFYPMLRKSDITDPTYEPYHESVEEEIEQVYADNGVLGAKNLLPYPYSYTTRTENGITWTDNKDGSITINGTSTAITTFRLIYGTGANLQWLANKIVSVSDISSPVGCQIALEQSPWTSIAPAISESRKESLIPSVPNNSSPYTIKLYVPANVTVNNLTVHPMLRLASDPDDTYQPYAMTNRELTDTKVDKAKTATDAKTTVFSESSKVSSCTAVLNDILCALRITSTAKASVSGAWTTIATLNDAYKPANLVYEAAIDDTGVPIGWTRIHADGKVEVYQSSGSAKIVNISSLYLRA